MYCKKLTKQELLDAGFTSVEYIDNQWRVFRRWRKNSSKEKFDTEISITLACGGDIPDGYIVTHINEDSFDNRPENLQLMTVGDNLKKRFESGEEAQVKQWGPSR